MKKSSYIIGILFSTFAVSSAFVPVGTGIIKGSIVIPCCAQRVFAVSGKDTVETDVKLGKFELNNLKIGNYTIIIAAQSPYKNYVVNNVPVSDDSFTDLGKIALTK